MKNGFKLIPPNTMISRIFHHFISKLFFRPLYISHINFFFLNKIREIFDPFYIFPSRNFPGSESKTRVFMIFETRLVCIKSLGESI